MGQPCSLRKIKEKDFLTFLTWPFYLYDIKNWIQICLLLFSSTFVLNYLCALDIWQGSARREESPRRPRYKHRTLLHLKEHTQQTGSECRIYRTLLQSDISNTCTNDCCVESQWIAAKRNVAFKNVCLLPCRWVVRCVWSAAEMYQVGLDFAKEAETQTLPKISFQPPVNSAMHFSRDIK